MKQKNNYNTPNVKVIVVTIDEILSQSVNLKDDTARGFDQYDDEL